MAIYLALRRLPIGDLLDEPAGSRLSITLCRGTRCAFQGSFNLGYIDISFHD
jgi:hypothetical protein